MLTPLGNGTFKMIGMFAEVFTALKASIHQIVKK
jgi:hypothetical protein